MVAPKSLAQSQSTKSINAVSQRGTPTTLPSTKGRRTLSDNLIHPKQCGLQIPSQVLSSASSAPQSLSLEQQKPVLIMAHRGASFHLPEHTLPAYRLALELGADFIELDLIMTKDGHFMALHSVDLEVTTNVASVFDETRQTVHPITNRTGYWVYDFTKSEIKQLRVRQRLPEARSDAFDGQFQIPSILEIFELVHTWNTQLAVQLADSSGDRKLIRAGIYAELKESALLQHQTGHNVVDRFLHHLDVSNATMSIKSEDADCLALKLDEYLVPPLVVESFDLPVLNEMVTKFPVAFPEATQVPPMVLLVDKSRCSENDWWHNVVAPHIKMLSGVGPDKACLMSNQGQDHTFMDWATKFNLQVHPWTERPETTFVSHEYHNEYQEMMDLKCRIQVHGIFAEDISTAVRAALTPCPTDNQQEEQNASAPSSGPSKVLPTPTTSTAACPDATIAIEGSSEESEAVSEDETLSIGVAAGIMGLFVGSIVTAWISQSRYCMSRRHRRRQLRIPTQEDVEMI